MLVGGIYHPISTNSGNQIELNFFAGLGYACHPMRSWLNGDEPFWAGGMDEAGAVDVGSQ